MTDRSKIVIGRLRSIRGRNIIERFPNEVIDADEVYDLDEERDRRQRRRREGPVMDQVQVSAPAPTRYAPVADTVASLGYGEHTVVHPETGALVKLNIEPAAIQAAAAEFTREIEKTREEAKRAAMIAGAIAIAAVVGLAALWYTTRSKKRRR